MMGQSLSKIREQADYLAPLNSPNLSLERRSVLQLLKRVKEIQDDEWEIEERLPSPLPFEIELSERMQNLTCVSCDKPVSDSAPYCTDYCSQVARTVRYIRKALQENTVQTIDKQIGISLLLTHIYGGGYPTKARHLPVALKRQIFERDSNLCQLCGDKATQIDHISGSSGDSSNLRALCGPCNVKEMWRNVRIINSQDNPEESQKILAISEMIASRVAAQKPSRICDDHLQWNKVQRKITAHRQKVFSLAGKE